MITIVLLALLTCLFGTTLFKLPHKNELEDAELEKGSV
jgi:hypothetical protein